MISPPRALAGLSEVAALYDGFIFDIWGVLHDGVSPFPGTVPALTELKRAGKKVCLLSNAPRLSPTVVEKLSGMGIAPSLYDGIVTSGDAGLEALQTHLLREWGRRCYYIGPAHNACIHEGLDIDIVLSPDAADFVLNSGVFDDDEAGKEYMAELRACRDAQLPMLCANPDKVVHVGERLILCPGTLAAAYEEMGGTVTYFGKPYLDVYKKCFGILNARRVLAVGDGMPTDILGASRAGVDAALVTSGIHRDDFAAAAGAALFAAHGVAPQYLLPVLAW